MGGSVASIALPPLDTRQTALWNAVLDLAERADDWTLIGGQMVFLHALEHGRTPPRISEDIDLIVDVRVRPPALPKAIAALADLGFVANEVTIDEIAHRLTRDDLSVDVLAPDGAGERVDLRTIGQAQTVPISGGSYALQRSERVDLIVSARSGHVFRPALDGALVIKARAALSDRKRGPDRHLRDLAFLCSLLRDPIAVRDLLSSKRRGYLRAVDALHDSGHEAWRGLGEAAGDAKAAFDLVSRQTS